MAEGGRTPPHRPCFQLRWAEPGTPKQSKHQRFRPAKTALCWAYGLNTAEKERGELGTTSARRLCNAGSSEGSGNWLPTSCTSASGCHEASAAEEACCTVGCSSTPGCRPRLSCRRLSAQAAAARGPAPSRVAGPDPGYCCSCTSSDTIRRLCIGGSSPPVASAAASTARGGSATKGTPSRMAGLPRWTPSRHPLLSARCCEPSTPPSRPAGLRR